MKTTRRSILTTSILALISTSGFAQTWTGGGDNVSWNQAANWNALPVSGPGAGIAFTNAASVVTNQNLGNPFVLNGLQAFGAGAVTVNGNGLTFDNGGNDAVIFGSTAVPSLTLNVPVAMVSNLQINNQMGVALPITGPLSGAGELRITSGITTLSGVGSWTGGTVIGYGSGQGTLRIAAANALSGSVGISFAAALEFAVPGAATFSNTITSGAGTIRQNGPGTVTLTGSNTGWNGTVDVANGILISSSVNALGGGFSQASVQNGGTLRAGVNDAFNGVANNVTINSGGALGLAGFQQTTPVNVTNNGSVNLPGTSSIAVGGNNTWTGSTAGPGSVSFGGFHNLNAGANLQHVGGTTVTGGQVTVNTNNALPDTGLLRISGGGLFHLGTETVDSILIDGGGLGATAMTATGAMDMQVGTASGNITVSGAFTKTTPGTASFNTGTLTMAAGGTISGGTFDAGVFSIINGTLLNNATFNVNAGTVNGPLTNNGTLNLDGVLNGATANAGTMNVGNGVITGTVLNTGTINATIAGSPNISANVSGPGNLTANAASISLTGTNSYTGGSVVTNSSVTGTTDSIQGLWSIPGSTLFFNQATPGTMAGTIGGSGSVQVIGAGKVTLTAANTFTGGIVIGFNSHLGIGNDAAAGVGGTIQGGGNIKLSAEGGARTVANPIVLSTGGGSIEFTGTNNLTFTDLAAKTISNTDQIVHSSSGTTSVAGTFLGQNTTTINVNAGTLVLGRAVNNGFRMDGAINVASGATLQMISNSPVKLGPTNLNGGTLIAASGVAVPTGLALTASGIIQGRVSSEAGSLIEATGALTLGDATSFGGFLSNGELRTQQFTVNILDKNQAVLGNLTEVGSFSPGNLTAFNGIFVDFGRAITGWGTVAGNNALANASIINGDAAGSSNLQPLDFTGYVKGIGTFTDVTFSGTFSPGLSPAIVPVNNVNFGPLAVILMEIGGLTPGSQHDQFDITGTLGLNGTLDVDLINGFNPSLGDTFNLFDGTTSGAFSAFSFPALNPGLSWDTTDLYTLGNLKIVPEPSSALLLLAGLGALLRRRR